MSVSKSRVWGLCLGLSLLVSATAHAATATAPSLRWDTVRHPDNNLPVMGDVLYAQGHYVAGGEGVLMTSSDGASWKTVFSDPNWVFGPTIYGGGQYVSNGIGVLAVSTDAQSWKEVAIPSDDAFFFLAYGRGLYVATGVQCTTTACASRVFTSTDLSTWVAHDLIGVSQDDFGPIAWNGSEFMVLTDNRTGHGKWALTSFDGLDWAAHTFAATAPTLIRFQQLRAVDGRFFALGGYNDEACVQRLLNNFCTSPYLAVSDDGSQWQQVKLTDPFELFDDIVHVGGQYLAVMDYDQACGICILSFKLLASSDGVHWAPAQGVPDDAEPVSVATDGKSAVAVGIHGSIVTAPQAGSSGGGGVAVPWLLALLLGWRSFKPRA
jgi:hypothetical protein